MRVLLFSTVVYLAGIAIVLFLRPALMFDREGRWKEFGIGRDDATVFPFWLFCITWAFVSYFLGRLILPSGPADWVQSASTAASLTTAASGLRGTLVQPLESEEPVSETNMVRPLPVSEPVAKGGRRRAGGAAAAAFSKVKQLKKLTGGGGGSSKSGKGSRALPKGLYFYVGGEGESEDEDNSFVEAASEEGEAEAEE